MNNVFKDLGFSDAEAVNLRVRSDLMIALEKHIKKRQLTQTAAAKQFKVDQPQISRLLNGDIEKFSVDKLLKMCAAAGLEVSLKVA